MRVVTIQPKPGLPPPGFVAAMDEEIMMSGSWIGRIEFHESTPTAPRSNTAMRCSALRLALPRTTFPFTSLPA